ncbi:hypothetical protein GGI43DRAFT_252869 [Trichoderma evansii]
MYTGRHHLYINHICGSCYHLLMEASSTHVPSQHICNLSILQSTMAKISGKIRISHCTKVTCPVPVLLTSHPLSRHGLSLGEVKEKGVEDEGEGGMDWQAPLSRLLFDLLSFFFVRYSPSAYGLQERKLGLRRNIWLV